MATFKSGSEYFNKRVRPAFDRIRAKNEPLIIASNSTHRLMAQRVFEKGENTAGRTFDYSSEEYKQTKRKFGRGKGRETAFVNFTFSGDLKSDFANGLIQQNIETFIVKLKRIRNAEVAEQLNERFGGAIGSLFSPNKDEKANFIRIAQKEFSRIFGA